MLQKNQTVETVITGMTAEGNGVGRVENMAVFVPLTAEGDRVRVKLIKVTKSYAVGRLEAVLEPSPDRIEADCAVFRPCGGCAYRHISYEAELRIKHQRVTDALQRIGGFADLPIDPVVGSDSPNGYRNKAQYPIRADENGHLHAGFFAQHSHRLIPCENCLLQPEEFSVLTKVFLEWAEERGLSAYDEEKNTGRLRHLCLRKAVATGEIAVCIVVNAGGLPGEAELAERLVANVPQVKSVVINVNRARTNVVLGEKCRTVYGQDEITDRLCGLTFRISPQSFYQVNHDQAERLYGLVREYGGFTGKELLLDLYCGTGTIGLTVADRVRRLIGVEIVEAAIADAKENAARNGVTNAEFFCADAAQAARMLSERGEKPDAVILDPPRKGCAEELLHIVADEMSPERIVYVSCDPATLARDMKLLGEMGYAPDRVTPVDLFSRTPHVETVVLLSRA